MKQVKEKEKSPPYTFGYYFRDGLGETFVLTQVLAVVAILLLLLYGNPYADGGEVVGLSILFANFMFLFIKIFAALFHTLFFRFQKPGGNSKVIIWLLAIPLGASTGTVLIYYLATEVFHSGLRPLPFLLIGNTLLAFTLSAYAFYSVSVKRKFRQQLQKTEEVKKLQVQAELSAIQAKLNPHFLFNTLNSILQMVHKSPDQVESIIVTLADIYRKILNLPKDGKILVKDEVELIEKYLQVEKIRMRDRLEFEINVDLEAEDIKIPPLLIEPLVENAVIHGLGPKTRGGKINLTISKTQDKLVVLILDNGQGFKDDVSESGFGLYSIQQRLSKMFGSSASLKILNPKKGITQVKLEFPYEN